VVAKTRFEIDGMICMSQRKIVKTVITLGKKLVFHHFAHLYRLVDVSQSYDNRTENRTFDLLV